MEKVWEARLDDQYHCRVVRESGSTGKLEIEQGGDILFSKPVALAYGAVFGPDVSDVAYWEDLCVAFVDGQSNENS
jgi:hypothetical protein